MSFVAAVTLVGNFKSQDLVASMLLNLDLINAALHL